LLLKSKQTSRGVGAGTNEQKGRETREQLKCGETREVAYTRRYTSGHFLVMDID